MRGERSRVAKDRKCDRCGKQFRGRYYDCQECRPIRAARAARARAEAKEEGYCSICLKTPRHLDLSMCETCIERQDRLHAVARERARASGTCTNCRHRKAEEGYLQCAVCKAKRRRAWAKENRQPRLAKEYILLSLRRAETALSLRELASDAGVTPRTVLRWVPRLIAVGSVVVTQEEGHGQSGTKFYRMGPNA